MTIRSTDRGHAITFKEGAFVFDDTGEPTVGSTRPCGHCGKCATAEGHDACISRLPGVKNACCGHGEVGDVYVQMLDGRYLQGWDAVVAIRKIKSPINGNRIDHLEWNNPLPRACRFKIKESDDWMTGTLHAWGQDHDMCAGQIGPYPVGIVEDEAGEMHSLYVEAITFDPETT